MTKKHNRRKTNKSDIPRRRIPAVVEANCDGDDEIYDEVDIYHKKYDDELLKLVKQPAKPIAKEILRVAPSDEEDDSDGEFIEENDVESEDEAPSTSDKWGKRRRNYYGTSYVDKDFGGVNDAEEDEILQLEEEDALIRQNKIESANGMVNFDQLIGCQLGSDDANMMNNVEIGDILRICPKRREIAADKETTEDQNEEASFLDNQEVQMDIRDDTSENDSNDCLISSERRRKITYEIRKNKGIRKDKGRKRVKKQHSRVMKRSQYEKALIRRRSQVPDLRREMTKYDGEKRGIRVSTIRSIKL